MDLTNRIMQSDIDYAIQEQPGAVAKVIKQLVHDIDSALANGVSFLFGRPVFLGVNNGMVPAAATSTLALLKGFLPYDNSGVIDQQGYSKPFYTTVPVLENGVVYLPCTGVMDKQMKVGVVIDPALTASYGKVVDITAGTPSGVLDISTVVTVEKKSNASVVLCNVKIG